MISDQTQSIKEDYFFHLPFLLKLDPKWNNPFWVSFVMRLIRTKSGFFGALLVKRDKVVSLYKNISYENWTCTFCEVNSLHYARITGNEPKQTLSQTSLTCLWLDSKKNIYPWKNMTPDPILDLHTRLLNCTIILINV